jgi:hypothetical protein
MKQRLARLEREASAARLSQCPRRHGAPVAVVHEEWEIDSHGPGFCRTGRRYVERDERDLVTDDPDDCRCRHCRKPAMMMVIMGIAGVSYEYRTDGR